MLVLKCTKMFIFTVLELSFAVEECFVLACLYEYRVCIVVCKVPNYGSDYYR